MKTEIKVSENSKDTLSRLKIVKELYRKNPNCNYSELYRLVMTGKFRSDATPSKPLFLL